MGNNPADDYFVASHGVKTPDAYWKVVVRGTGQDERAIAWVVPNIQEATRKRLDDYLVSVAEIERVTGEKKYRLLIMQNTTNLVNLG
jgi:endonuclease G